MRIRIICPVCSADGYGRFYFESIRDDGLYKGQCPVGHEVLLATQTLRHEMLFEVALNAIIDGYYREAVASFYASAERYYEFVIRVLARKTAMPDNVLRKAWKYVAAQSERQLGAYILLYASCYGKMPTLPKTKTTELRNKVIHRGILPTREQAIEFGKDIYSVIQDGVRQLRTDDLTHVNNEMVGQFISKIADARVTEQRWLLQRHSI